MGILFTRIWNSLFHFDEFKVIVVGLNNAGKTTTLYKLLLDEVVVTNPTIGSNVEEITYKNAKFIMWDIGGQESLRTSWHTYYQNAHVVILVVDSTDKDRIGITKEELFKMLNHEHLKTARLLIFANKQDLKGAMTPAEISDLLGLHSIKDHSYHIQGCCALTGQGYNIVTTLLSYFRLYEGMDWVVQQVKKK